MVDTVSSVFPEKETLATCEKLLDTFSGDLQNRKSNEFLTTLNGIIRQVTLQGNDVSIFYEVLFTMHRQLLPILVADEVRHQAENLWQQACVIIGGIAQRVLAHQKLLVEKQARTVYAISQDLITTFDVSELMDMVIQELPRLGIESCYVSLSEKCTYFRSKIRARSQVALFKEELFGTVLFSLENLKGTVIHETLCLQISSALKGAMLHQEGKRAEERIQKELKEKKILLKEINHRVKNNLTVIASLLSLQESLIQTKQQAIEAFRESRARINTMIHMHQRLYESEEFSRIDMKSYIERLVKELFHAYDAGESVALELRLKDIYMNINTAIPCGLILNELVTNIFKYAFPDGRKGSLQISLVEKKNQMYELIVRDDGVGLSRDMNIEKLESFGLQLILMLTKQIDGVLKIDVANGTRFEIAFPVKNP